MSEPRATRPYMPGYGIAGPEDEGGLLPWAWPVERLTRAHDYWVATTWPDGRPHVMPVWGIWHADDELWFSSARRARKARNLAADPRCVVTTDDAREPVVVQGVATELDALDALSHYADAVNHKYSTDIGVDFYAADDIACFRVRPSSIIALSDANFTGSPTRWELG